MKKFICIASMLVMLFGLTVAGCTKPIEHTEADINFDPAEEVTLRIAVSNDPNETTIANAFAEAYMEKYENKTVVVEQMPGDYVNSVVFDFNAGILQDIIWMGDDNLNYLADLEVLMNLSDFMDMEKESGAEDAFDESLYFEAMLKMGRKNQSGDYYMLPRDYNKNVIFFNKDLLTEAGAEIPTDNDWTWEEFKDYVKDVNAKMVSKGMTLDKGYETIEGANLDWKAVVYPMLKSYGGTFLNEQGKPAFKTDAMEKTLTDIGWFAQNGYAQPIGQTGARGSFVAKKAAMYIGSRPTVGSLIQQKINFGVVGYPQTGNKDADGNYTNPLIGSGTTGYGINSSTEHPADAWNFVKFILSEDGQEAFSATGSCVPVLKSMANDPDATWRSYPEIDNTDAFVLYEDRDCTIDIFNTAPAEYETILMGNYSAMIMDVTNGTRGVQDAIDYYFEEISKSLE